MRAGADVIYQGVLIDGDWRGIADFIVRVPKPSSLGAWSYEVWDTKLGRHAKPTYAVQLSFYTERIADLQGVIPDWMCVVLGDGQIDRLKPSDFLAYYRSLRRRFMRFIEPTPTTSPYPVEHCGICQHSDKCLTEWRETDHLCLVAGIRRETVARLEKAGVSTMAALATCTTKPDRAINDSTFATIRDQAALQRSFINSGSHSFQLVSPAEERGFALLPEPSPGDLFFDMEGYPYYEPKSSLEYLFGVAWLEGETPRFRPWWGTDRDQEKAAFEAFIDFVRDRLRQDPNLHVYHYASYERTKLGVLAQQHATREEELDDLLRRQVFVDLYKVVRQALRASHEGYSLKDIRQFFMPADASPAAVATASDSVVAFAEWLLSKDPALLTAIEQYNSEDCISTLPRVRASDARPDFLVTTPNGDQIVVEVKGWESSSANTARAIHQVQRYKELTKAAAAVIVTAAGQALSSNAGAVVPIAQLVSTLTSLAAAASGQKRPKAVPTSRAAPNKRVFASMPFAGQYDDTFLVAIEPAALASGAIAERVDHNGIAGHVVTQIRQPYVELILRGIKREEYRTTPTRIRERVWLYASAKPGDDATSWRRVGRAPSDLPAGAIVGSVKIVGCRCRGPRDYAYALESPKRLKRRRYANNQPQPVLWRPKF